MLFVGEALVGNEAVDQLTKFNQALADHSTAANPHLIDGIVLTKFDTIDDKVISAQFSSTFDTQISITFYRFPGWGSNFNDIYNWTANCIRWNRSNLHRSEGIKCQSCRACINEVEPMSKPIFLTILSQNYVSSGGKAAIEITVFTTQFRSLLVFCHFTYSFFLLFN